MGEAVRTIRVVTSDDSLIASARSAAASMGEWEVQPIESGDALLADPPAEGDVILLDAWMRGANVYEFCRRLTGRTRCRTFVVHGHGNDLALSIARFCGATGVIARPVSAGALREALAASEGARPASRPEDGRGEEPDFELPERLLVDIHTGELDASLVSAIIDADSGLFNYGFLNYKLDEEFKRARRFDQPLSCVMLGFEGQAAPEVLRELAGIFLLSSRDTDILGRFDENSFLFLLPHTGPDGAAVMAHRVAELAEERRLSDLVGDPVRISVGISSYPHPAMERREELYASARQSFLEARREGGGVVTAG